MPELWEGSAFRCSKSKLYLKSILGGVSCVVMVLGAFFQMSMPQAVILVIITIVGIPLRPAPLQKRRRQARQEL